MKVYSKGVKLKTVEAAQLLLTRVGCEVTEIREGNVFTLVVTVPEDSVDPHGDALRAAMGQG